MHNPSHLVQIAQSAHFIAKKMDYCLVVPDGIPGYLVVEDISRRKLLSIHVGTYGHLCDDKFADLALTSNSWILSHRLTEELVSGVTSSDFDQRMSGSVIASELLIGFASRDGHSQPLSDEAIAIAIALKAGVLLKSAVRRRYCNRHLKEHNPYLRQMIDNITWTN